VPVVGCWSAARGERRFASTQIYLRADMEIKERALARVTPIYRPTDALLAFLEGL
jgi:integrase/recombinase XerD